MEAIISGDKSIPHVVGVRCLKHRATAARRFDVTRADRSGKVFQHYLANPSVRELYVGYRASNGRVQRSAPVVYYVNQVYEVTRKQGDDRVVVDSDPTSPLRGRPLGSGGSLREFLRAWREALAELFRRDGIVQWFRITQGNVIEKTDGTVFQLRSFKRDEPWMNGSPFRNIQHVHRSPFRSIGRSGGSTS